MKYGIDVAKWNVITDYKALKDNGVQFAIVKVINKANTADGLFATHVAGFRSAGIPCTMGYTYSYANTVELAKKAAQAYVDIAKTGGITYMWLDLEDVSMQGLGSTLVDIIKAYRDIANANGLNFGIYTYASYYNSYVKKYISSLSGIPFWIARYPSTAEMKITDGAPSTKNLPNGIAIYGWQYSSKGTVDGVKGNVDLNVWYQDTPQNNTVEVSIDTNPFVEPTEDCKVGTTGNDANWCLWWVWRCGKLLDDNNKPDYSKIDGYYTRDTADKVKEIQTILNLKADGIVGTKTRASLKKLL